MSGQPRAPGSYLAGQRRALTFLASELGTALTWKSERPAAMLSVPANEYVELREGRYYYLSGTRIGLVVLILAFRRGETPEAIFQKYPSIGSLAKVYGAIAFILEHPQAIESYLQEQEALWKKFREEHPIPEDMLERLRRTREELTRHSA